MPSAKLPLEKVKAAASGRWVEILSDLGGVSADVLNGRHHPCPKCGGRDRFRLVDEAAGALYCNQCFTTKNGDGVAALSWLTGKDFRETVLLLAGHLGIEAPATREKRSSKDGADPNAGLELQEWNDTLVEMWTAAKGGISLEAVRANGGQLGFWHGCGERHQVIALPIVGRTASTKLPRGWVLYQRAGGTLPTSSGPVKVRLTRGSQNGWVGTAALERIADAATVWKVEGVSDLLALYSAIPAEARGAHVVLTNPFGAKQVLGRELLEVLVGKRVVVVADRDEAGEAGAKKWADAIARHAAETRIVAAPGGPGGQEWGGKDLRDFLLAGGTFAELQAHVEASSSLVEPPGAGAAAADGETEYLDEKCPLRLAIEFERYRLGGIRFWREDFYLYDDGRWRSVSIQDVRQVVTLYLAKTLRLRAEEAAKEGVDDARAPRITHALVSDVLSALKARSGVASDVEWCTWVERDPEGVWRAARRESGSHVATFQNGTLDIGRIVRHLEAQELRELDPSWWSPHVLPYRYDPRAQIGPHWERFLELNLGGDSGVIQLLQEWTGYCLLPWTGLQKSLVLEGEGANGKSVYQAVLEAVVGPANCSHVGIDLLGERFACAGLVGRLVNITDEVGRLDTVAEGKLRALISGQAVTVDRKGKDAQDLVLPVRLCTAWNERPRLKDRTEAIWRRFLVVPMRWRVPPEERVPGMDSVEWWVSGPGAGELPGIFNWALEGLASLWARGRFEEPEVVRDALEEFREGANPTQEFLREALEAAPLDESVSAADLYAEYREWMGKRGYFALGERQFGQDVRRVFPGVDRRRTTVQTATGKAREYRYFGIRRLLDPDFD